MTIQEAIEILQNPDDWYGVDENDVMLPDCEYAKALGVIGNAENIIYSIVNRIKNGELCGRCTGGAFFCKICGIKKIEAELKPLYEGMTCRVCGCTDSHACEGGCYWVEPGLCNKCAEKEKLGAR